MASSSMEKYKATTISRYTETLISDLGAVISRTDLPTVIRYILLHADGGILWARFAADEAALAILEGDRLEKIMQRPEVLPSDLKLIYKRLLDCLNTVDAMIAGAISELIEQWPN